MLPRRARTLAAAHVAAPSESPVGTWEGLKRTGVSMSISAEPNDQCTVVCPPGREATFHIVREIHLCRFPRSGCSESLWLRCWLALAGRPPTDLAAA